MDYLAFLEKDAQFKLQIFSKLEENGDHSLSTKAVLDELSLSRYKLKKLIESLAADLKSLDEIACELEINEEELVCPNANIRVYQTLQLKYLKQSPLFQIYQYEYVDHNNESRSQFLQDHFLSRSKFYVLRGEVEDILNHEERVSGNTPSSSMSPEVIKRVKLTNIYYHFFKGIEDPFPELSAETARFCNFLTMTLELSLTPSERLKLRIFYQIQFKRLQGRNFMNIRKLAKLKHDVRIPFLKNYYQKYVKHSAESDIESEIAYLYLFLISQNIVTELPITISGTLMKQYQNSRERFAKILHETPVLKQDEFKPVKQEEIAEKLADYSNWLLVFDFNEFGQLTRANDHHLLRNFPGLTILAKSLVKAAIKAFNLKLTEAFKRELTKGYLRVLIDNIPISLVKDTVTICVDFVQNEIPMDYFSELININLGGGINFADHLSSEVDIYVSDIFVSSIRDIPQVTWPDPLRLSSWESLRQKIIQVKQAKVAQFYTE